MTTPAVREAVLLIGNLRQRCSFNADGGWELLYAAEEHLIQQLVDDAVVAEAFVCESCELACAGKPFEVTYFQPKKHTLKFCPICFDEQVLDEFSEAQRRRELYPWMFDERYV
jgi:hypothetical protein